MKPFRWGIFGTGAVSAKFIAGLASAPDMRVEFVASRSAVAARCFAAGFGVPRAIEGYTEAARQAGVDAVYIASPPSEHAGHALLCLQAGLPILVEKPFASSEQEARLIAETARARSLLAMEAIWTRFLPAVRALQERLVARTIGEVRLVSGNFGLLPDTGNSPLQPRAGQAICPSPCRQWLAV